MLKFLCLVMSFLLIFTFTATATEVADLSPLEAVPVMADGEALDLKANSAILIEQGTGRVLYEKDSSTKSAPASITKIMSLILVFEAIDNGALTYDTILTCSDSAAALGGSQIWLEPGETMSVHELLKAVCVVSANDATVMLAEAVAGSEESFVALMNDKAKELNMNNTNFVNCTGLDAENHYSCALDVALMSAELLKHEKVTEYTTIWMDSLRNGESELVNTNKLVRFYEGCTGLKTGTTSGAGYCLSASAKRDGLSLIAVVMNGETSKDRFAAAQKLLNYGYAHYKNMEIVPSNEEFSVKVNKGTVDSLKLTAERTLYALVKKSEKGEITSQVMLPDSVKAPIKKGDKIGEIVYSINDREIGIIELLSDKNIEKKTVFSSFVTLFRALFITV